MYEHQTKNWTYSNQENSKKLQKKYFQQNKEKLNESRKQYLKKSRDTDVNFSLIKNRRFRNHHAIISLSKLSSPVDVLGKDIDS